MAINVQEVDEIPCTKRINIDQLSDESVPVQTQVTTGEPHTTKNADLKNAKRLSIKKLPKKQNTKSVLTIQTNKSITNLNSVQNRHTVKNINRNPLPQIQMK